MRKRLITIGGCLFAFILSAIMVVDSADAKSGSGSRGKPPKHAPEPISCILFAAGGGTMMGLRYLRNRRKSKESIHRHNDSNAEVS